METRHGCGSAPNWDVGRIIFEMLTEDWRLGLKETNECQTISGRCSTCFPFTSLFSFPERHPVHWTRVKNGSNYILTDVPADSPISKPRCHEVSILNFQIVQEIFGFRRSFTFTWRRTTSIDICAWKRSLVRVKSHCRWNPTAKWGWLGAPAAAFIYLDY